MAKEYDVVVLGAGPGGYIAAIRASQLGLATAIVEKKYWGGVCLNVGCIPSKALLRNAELAQILTREADQFGISGDFTLDYGKAFKRSRRVSNGLTKGVQFLMRKNKIAAYEGWATILDEHSLQVEKNDGSNEALQFKHLIIATGATTRLLPGTALSENVVTYEEQIMEDALPASIIIAGAGAIGVEFAYIMANYGVDVTLVEYMRRILPLEDPEVSAELTKAFKKLGIQMLVNTSVEAIDDTVGAVAVTVTTPDGEQRTLHAERALQAIGFAPRVAGFGLENLGVALNEAGGIAINERMQTNLPHIYAVGDVTAKLMLAHVAEVMGVAAAEHIAGEDSATLDFDMMPRATYCQPQVASFGYTEQQAKERGYQINVAKFPFQANGKARGLGDASGFVKLISDAKYGEILGAHMIGHDVTELLPELTLARSAELTPQEIARNVHAHPTLSEALKEAAHGLEGSFLNA
ncbi:MAG: dihydrolipoyl dehydrogenase [Chloroflexi bacterium]|nr:dihydrolipoyl dehydrogenase [Chloroflexota bacterium]MCY3582244.1 dihydrolipoyl dehydrogenase [Chloroflexota bacterium]MCY3715016.1 dihydrolipoyl dehydrogenase [Chloroflexota bacterium]MDE2650542.1 dihydrolipoyl dehydrogenase [Chloroflexota bacterium]MXX50517.1 dihydrolipoyl dehydrogenase [Chloroflexota bacterium]